MSKEKLKETIDKLQEHVKTLENFNQGLQLKITKLKNRLQLIKATADEGFI